MSTHSAESGSFVSGKENEIILSQVCALIMFVCHLLFAHKQQKKKHVRTCCIHGMQDMEKLSIKCIHGIIIIHHKLMLHSLRNFKFFFRFCSFATT